MAPVQYDDTEFHQKLCRKLNCHLPSLNPIHFYDFPSEPENIYQERHEEGESYSFHPSINLIPSQSFSCFYRSDEAKNGLILPTGQWYAPSAVIYDAWYCMELNGIALYCIVLQGIAWYCMVLHGIAWYCMVLHGIA